ncbi:MAG: fatty acid hydroxylase family protein [Winogradskyella sp.]|uniref:sterol desaturase family protein n=1 Tax=Winogradskyella sp. TaxID=1883156 RepID=UPI000F3D8A1F|nr:sterol desaturase family protein [Winogradskyella sp.]RNC87201.1 MAG: fatty acid hydroxylase family protein [Winogradskyella sp.]
MENLLSTLPSLKEVFMNPVSYIVYIIYGGLIIWEAIGPAEKLPHVNFWKLKGFLSFILFFLLSSYLPYLWDGFLSKYQLLDLTSLGTVFGGIVGVFVYELGEYIWHRTMHNSDFLWKVFHQMHHSAERLDSFGAFYFSPVDMIGWTALSSLCLVLVAGFTPEATVFIILVTNFMSIFQHANVKTPQWIGYLIQRPESHNIHHGRGIHAYNYCGLPLYDIIFGTFKNPKSYENKTGFYDGASSKIMEMISFKDISIRANLKNKA